MDLPRVVITGLGLVTPLGTGVSKVWDRLTAGESGIRRITHFPVADLPCQIAGVVPLDPSDPAGLDPTQAMGKQEVRRNDLFILYGMAAAREAIEDAGLEVRDDAHAERIGVLMGSGIGGVQTMADGSLTLDKGGWRKISPFFIPSALVNLLAGQVSIKYGLRGPNHSVVTACSTGVHSIGDAARMIQWGDADVMIAGSAEAVVSRIGIAGFCAARALSTKSNDRPTEASRPYDTGRDGFVMGDGAGVVVVESLEHARARGARIHAEIVGYGMSGDGYHITAPPEDGNGGYRSMRAALNRAAVNADEIDYINTHGTSTQLGDVAEVRGMRRLLGNAAGQVSISSTKSAIGHLLGAAGSAEAIFCVKAIETGIIPPTINLHDIDPECEGLDLTPLVAKERRVDVALSNSFGFGGTNASIVLKRFAG